MKKKKKNEIHIHNNIHIQGFPLECDYFFQYYHYCLWYYCCMSWVDMTALCDHYDVFSTKCYLFRFIYNARFFLCCAKKCRRWCYYVIIRLKDGNYKSFLTLYLDFSLFLHLLICGVGCFHAKKLLQIHYKKGLFF